MQQNVNHVNGQIKRDHLLKLSTPARENTVIKRINKDSSKRSTEQLKRLFYFSQKEGIING